ncbi:DUF6234 family protein [Streptomyces sp. NPDC056144]|uniref:DUF6234 family protein n=1 Tax=unclassified Streptomyces TaxID=2593676 RepID=UPI0035DA58D5
MATTPRPRVRTAHDVLFALALLLLDGVLALITLFMLGLRAWTSVHERVDTWPPPMDWIPVLLFVTMTAGLLLLAFALRRGGWPWSAGAQFLAAGLLAVATVAVGTEEWTRSHPAPPSAPAPAEQRCVCTSGGGPCECPGG